MFFDEIGVELPSLDKVDEQDNPLVVAHFVNGDWDWFVVAGEVMGHGDYYLFGLVNGIERELGFFTLNQIRDVGAVLDRDFVPCGVFDIYDDFDLRV